MVESGSDEKVAATNGVVWGGQVSSRHGGGGRSGGRDGKWKKLKKKKN